MSEETAEVFVRAAQECPFDKEVYRYMFFNSDCKSAKSAVDLNRFRTHCGWKNVRTVQKILKDFKCRETFVEQFVKYIHHLLILSCLAENKTYQRELSQWMQGKFLPASTQGLGPIRAANTLRPILEQLALFPSVSARPASDDGQQGAANGSGVKSDNDDVKVVAVVTDFAAFQNLNGRCYHCRQSTSAQAPQAHHVCVLCKGMSCRTCFGAPRNAARNLQYMCNWCLPAFHAKIPLNNTKLLCPVRTCRLCFLCHCSLSAEASPGWCKE